jgi:hypothetical protein
MTNKQLEKEIQYLEADELLELVMEMNLKCNDAKTFLDIKFRKIDDLKMLDESKKELVKVFKPRGTFMLSNPRISKAKSVIKEFKANFPFSFLQQIELYFYYLDLIIGWITSTKGWYPSRYEANAIDIVDNIEALATKIIWPTTLTDRIKKLGDESNDGYCTTVKERVNDFIKEKTVV